MLAIGASSLIWQVASARSIMSALHGNELILGLVLCCWLALMGLATALAARLGRGLTPHGLLSSLAAVLAIFPAGILGSMALQEALMPGLGLSEQVTGPGWALIVSLICLLPPCSLLGGAFGLVSVQAPCNAKPEQWASRIYLWESLGTVAAGLMWHLWLARLPLEAIGLVAGGLPWVVSLALLAGSFRRDPRRFIALIWALVLGACGLVYLVPGLPLPGRAWLHRGPPGYELLERRNSSHAQLAVLRRQGQILFLANGQRILSNQGEEESEPRVHLSLLAHPAPGRVMMIGGGLGGGLRQALKHPIQRLDYVELDPLLMTLARKWMGAPLRTVLQDPRVKLQIDDGRRVLAANPGTYDVILVDLPGPSSALANRFYTEEFFAIAHRALRPGGLLRVILTGSETYLPDSLARTHATVLSGMRRVFGNASALAGPNTLLLCGKGKGPDLSPATLIRRFTERRLRSLRLGAPEIRQRAQALPRDLYLQRLKEVPPATPNTDLHPSAYFHAATLWLEITSPDLAQTLAWLAELAGWGAWIMLCLPMGLVLLWGLARRRASPGGAAALAIAMAGLSGMMVELSLLLACQEMRGVIFHELGILLAAFMAGLAGGAIAGRALMRWPAAALRLALLGCAGAALLGAGIMKLAVGLTAPPPMLVFLAPLALSGLAVGSCYAPAVAALARATNGLRSPGQAAARGYAWDLAGAAVGGLLASAFVLPVLGLVHTCLLCASLCLACVAVLRQ